MNINNTRSSADFHVVEEGQTVLQIHQLALELVLHDIDQSQLAGNALFIILKIDNVYLIMKI